MKPVLISILAAIALYFGASAQYTVTPAVGIGNIKLQMPITDIIKIIGTPDTIVTYQNEKAGWQKCGYKTDSETIFTFHFDEVYVFDNTNPYGIWRVYCDKGHAVIMNICKLTKNEAVLKNVVTNGGLTFNSDSAAITTTMGTHYTCDADRHTNFVFLQTGISFILVDNTINNMFVFNASDKKETLPPCFITNNFFVKNN